MLLQLTTSYRVILNRRDLLYETKEISIRVKLANLQLAGGVDFHEIYNARAYE